eukprot:3402879-Prymnesium_polylepis.1
MVASPARDGRPRAVHTEAKERSSRRGDCPHRRPQLVAPAVVGPREVLAALVWEVLAQLEEGFRFELLLVVGAAAVEEGPQAVAGGGRQPRRLEPSRLSGVEQQLHHLSHRDLDAIGLDRGAAVAVPLHPQQRAYRVGVCEAGRHDFDCFTECSTRLAVALRNCCVAAQKLEGMRDLGIRQHGALFVECQHKLEQVGLAVGTLPRQPQQALHRECGLAAIGAGEGDVIHQLKEAIQRDSRPLAAHAIRLDAGALEPISGMVVARP